MMKSQTPLWTSAQAAKATRGDVTQGFVATGVSINTRTLKPGDLFVALVGPKIDGHDHVAKAFELGAVAAVVSHRPPVFDPDTPLLMVEDTMQALEDLGVYARKNFKGQVIAVTGSVGKTGTKEALNIVLRDQAKTTASIGSHNNHWGLPLSLARMDREARYGVMELGMNHPGELIPLSKMTQPDVCMITTVQAAHTEFFANTTEIAKAKAEIFQGAKPDWKAVINADISETIQLKQAARDHKAAEIITFGESINADFRVVVFKMEEQGSTITALTPIGPLRYYIASPGRHWVLNSLGVLAAVHALGGDVRQAAESLSKVTPPKSRGERFDVQLKDGTFALIDESYNASPAAVGAALAVLGAQPVASSSRRIAVLGDMLELGEDTPQIHRDLGEVLISSGVDTVYLAGEAMQHLWDALPKKMQGHHCQTSKQLADVVKAKIRPGDVVMVKGSAGSKMDVVVKKLRALDKTRKKGEG
ncbi:MAG: UDP-N-acetylmuramoylalanyl-D-glutamyl-2, 6-diaminopimelate--D-alanyl-D-alanine ligase [Rhodospirillaceae bacterium]|nr:MAG: UDP-N-acetylmuramoylalanyl-D-glutamyl-2, 6-diaminopimelate--D-alanyl-D-alanine ligase [Rhodospirillaceae bacterium]